jgi:hypothetical protein
MDKRKNFGVVSHPFSLSLSWTIDTGTRVGVSIRERLTSNHTHTLTLTHPTLKHKNA